MADSDSDTLFQGQDARISQFSAPTPSDSESLDKRLLLQKGFEPVIAEGRFRIYKILKRKATFLQCGKFVHPLLPRSRLTRVTESVLVFPQPIPGKYWRITLLWDSENDIDCLEGVLTKICCYENSYKEICLLGAEEYDDDDDDKPNEGTSGDEVSTRHRKLSHFSNRLSKIWPIEDLDGYSYAEEISPTSHDFGISTDDIPVYEDNEHTNGTTAFDYLDGQHASNRPNQLTYRDSKATLRDLSISAINTPQTNPQDHRANSGVTVIDLDEENQFMGIRINGHVDPSGSPRMMSTPKAMYGSMSPRTQPYNFDPPVIYNTDNSESWSRIAALDLPDTSTLERPNGHNSPIDDLMDLQSETGSVASFRPSSVLRTSESTRNPGTQSSYNSLQRPQTTRFATDPGFRYQSLENRDEWLEVTGSNPQCPNENENDVEDDHPGSSITSDSNVYNGYNLDVYSPNRQLSKRDSWNISRLSQVTGEIVSGSCNYISSKIPLYSVAVENRNDSYNTYHLQSAAPRPQSQPLSELRDEIEPTNFYHQFVAVSGYMGWQLFNRVVPSWNLSSNRR